MRHETLNQQDNIRALANHLEITYSEAEMAIDDESYMVYTEEEATEAAYEYMEQSLWAFNHSFVSRFSSVAREIPKEHWQRMSSILCEDFNSAVLAMVRADNNFEVLVEEAIYEDGLGHFLNSYDGTVDSSDDVCTCNLDQTYIIVRLG